MSEDTIYRAFNDGLLAREMAIKVEGFEDEIRFLREEITKCRKRCPTNDWPHTTPEAKAYKAGLAGAEMP